MRKSRTAFVPTSDPEPLTAADLAGVLEPLRERGSVLGQSVLSLAPTWSSSLGELAEVAAGIVAADDAMLARFSCELVLASYALEETLPFAAKTGPAAELVQRQAAALRSAQRAVERYRVASAVCAGCGCDPASRPGGQPSVVARQGLVPEFLVGCWCTGCGRAQQGGLDMQAVYAHARDAVWGGCS